MRAALHTHGGRFYRGLQLWGLLALQGRVVRGPRLPGRPRREPIHGRKRGPRAPWASRLCSATPTSLRESPSSVALGRASSRRARGRAERGWWRAERSGGCRRARRHDPDAADASPLRTDQGVTSPRVTSSPDVYNTIQLTVANTALPTRIRPNRAFRLNAVTIAGKKAADGLGANNAGGRLPFNRIAGAADRA
jgi:hypothetical protein